jgi:hypothetical protein
LLTVQDLASVNSQGSIVAETRQYPGLSHPALAARVAQRDLTASTAALARIHVRFTRAAATIRPGDVIKLSWAKLGISSLVCRVLDVSYGGLNNGEIRAELAEDVFGLPSSSYQEDQPTGWAPGSDDPAPVADQYVMEGTYWDISHDMNPADVAALSDTSGFLYTLAEAENAAQYSHGIYSRIAPADFTLAIDEQPFALKTQLAVSVIRSDTEIEVDDTGNGEFGLAIAVGDRLILPGGTTEEQMEVTDLTNLATGIIGVNRAILDTTPQEIANGTDVWLLEYTEEDFGRDGVERFDGDTVDYKLTSTSSTGESPPELAPVQTLTYDSRLFRPYPPGKIRIEGEAFPAGDVLPGFTLDWAHRDRLQQTSAFVAQDDDSIGPEAGTTYNVYFYDDDTDTLKHTELNVDDDTFTMPEVAGIFTARIEIESERDGVVSWERQIRTFSYLGSYPIRGALVTDSASTSLTLDAETIVNWDTETSDWGGYFTAASADLAVPSDALGWHFMASNITHAAGAAAWHSGSFLLAKSGSPAWGSLNIGVYERPALTTAQARSYGGLAKANSGCILNQDVNWYGGSGSRSIAAGGTLGIAKMWADTVIGGQLTRTSTQSISHNTESTVTMTAEYVDDGGCIDIAGQPTRFTAPAAGWYIATGITKWPSTGTVSARGTYLRKNGSGPHVGSHRITVGNVTNVSTAPVASIVYLSASDYLELRTFHNNGAAVNLSSAYWQAARLDTSDTIGATVQYDGTAQTINTGSDVLITFDNEVIDDDGMVNLGSQAGRITATVEGLYAVVGHMGFATNTGTDRTLKLKVDGSTTIAEDCIDAPANHGAPIPNVSAIVYLTVGQYVSLYAATGTNTSSATGDHRPRLSMVLLAAA